MKATILIVLVTLFLSFGLLYGQATDAMNTGTDQTTEDAGQTVSIQSNVTPWSVFNDSNKGFPWGYIIAVVFAIGLALGIVKTNSLYFKEKIDAQQVYNRIRNHLKQGQLDEAIKISEGFNKTTIGFIFWNGLLGFRDAKNSGKKGEDMSEHVYNAFDEANLQKIKGLESGLMWFELLAQICTYLGLLGTIWGLIMGFDAMGTLTGPAANEQLTLSIKVAIGTTAVGLVAAIVLTVIKGLLTTKSLKIQGDVDEFSAKLINQINYSMKG